MKASPSLRQTSEQTNLQVADLSASARRVVQNDSQYIRYLEGAIQHRDDEQRATIADLEYEIEQLKFKLSGLEYRNYLLTKEMERLLGHGPANK